MIDLTWLQLYEIVKPIVIIRYVIFTPTLLCFFYRIYTVIYKMQPFLHSVLAVSCYIVNCRKFVDFVLCTVVSMLLCLFSL